ncbi:E3 SUMO-protein ligase PIAS4 isoform 3 [Corchorus olitorius]|uniref:E3 SUMO-protein ligase PIAS4 isoform 3 n=1 Tax=Corchorus olitorius TaxID=93759 RepID=A0A1R3JFB2_9ROSI|nr:E3 SUMO-protein ligase PIAS4 isoform 3 [Corchorus olitorius]
MGSISKQKLAFICMVVLTMLLSTPTPASASSRLLVKKPYANNETCHLQGEHCTMRPVGFEQCCPGCYCQTTRGGNFCTAIGGEITCSSEI